MASVSISSLTGGELFIFEGPTRPFGAGTIPNPNLYSHIIGSMDNVLELFFKGRTLLSTAQRKWGRAAFSV